MGSAVGSTSRQPLSSQILLRDRGAPPQVGLRLSLDVLNGSPQVLDRAEPTEPDSQEGLALQLDRRHVRGPEPSPERSQALRSDCVPRTRAPSHELMGGTSQAQRGKQLGRMALLGVGAEGFEVDLPSHLLQIIDPAASGLCTGGIPDVASSITNKGGSYPTVRDRPRSDQRSPDDRGRF
jgi:hypothetical protein